MVFNSLSAVNQRPYMLQQRDAFRHKQEEEKESAAKEAQKDLIRQRSQSRGLDNQNENNSNQQSKGLSAIDNTPKARPIINKDGISFSVKSPENIAGQASVKSSNIQPQVYAMPTSAYQNSISPNSINRAQGQFQQTGVQQAQSVTTNPIEMRSDKINIAQIIKDFKNTAAAIGTPDDLNAEVADYLDLIQKQVTKENPNEKLVKSNLKNASSILDGYITQTLNKDSKVVENWLDALFLQKIDFKYNEGDVNPQFLVKFPQDRQPRVEEQQEPTQTTTNPISNEQIGIPQDKELKAMFVQAKKLTYANEPKKAMKSFQNALNRATEIGDKETTAKIQYEVGKIYDKNDYLSRALTSYNKSAETTSDYNLKTQVHFSMAQIYDDVNQVEPAIDHYFTSIAYAGEADNIKAQSTSLTKLGNIFADQYNNDAIDYLQEANLMAAQTDDAKVKAFVNSNTANAYNKLNKPESALEHYGQAIKNYSDLDAPEKIAVNYKRAAEVMKDYNNPQKAKSLLQKALFYARRTDDVQLMKEINEQLKQA